VLRVEVLDLGVVVESMRRLLERTIPEDIVIATTAAPDLGRVKATPPRSSR